MLLIYPYDKNFINKHDIIDIDNPFVSGFLTMYSMETFFYKNLNYSMRTKDKDKYVSLGPMSVALNWSI